MFLTLKRRLEKQIADNIQWHLETAAVAFYVFSSVIAPFVGVFLFFAMLFSPFCLFAWLYIAWFIYDCKTPERGARPNPAVRNWYLYKLIQSYFPIKLVKTADLSPEHNYLIGTHPHGILSFGPFISLCTNATGFDKLYPGIESTIATLKGMFWFPIRREQVLLMSSLIAVNKESIHYYLSQKPKGRALAVVVGGANEVLTSHPKTYRLCLATRKGFVRAAIENGAYLVPMYNFGENETYYQIPNEEGSFVRNLQGVIKKIVSYAPTLILGRGWTNPYFGLLPFRVPITSVIGKPIPVVKNTNPTQQEVDELHARYCKELVELFEEHKLKHGIKPTDHLILY